VTSGPQGDDPDEDPEHDPQEPAFPQIPGFDLSGIDLSQLARMLQSSGPLNREVATQVAAVVATDGQDEPPVDEAAAAELEELAHAAQTHVVSETGLAATFAAPVRVVTRREWAALHLDALYPVLETLAETFGRAFRVDLGATGDDMSPSADEGLPPEAAALAGLLPMVAPLLLGVQAGSMVGHLARHALGRYDLPLPTSDQPSLCFTVPNLDAFEDDWSLARTDLRFYVAIHEVVHAAERSVPWVRKHLVDLAIDYVSAYEIDPAILEVKLGDIDPSDPSSIQRLAEQPEELLGAMQSDRQRAVLDRARVFHAVLDGYADAILERVGERLIPSFAQIHEAMARHRIERGEAERFVEGLLGLGGRREDYERGGAFCHGVFDRAGPDGLDRLWANPEMEPTPSELDAPGLWLARIDLDLDEPDEGSNA
jgi:putative hydrolase